MKRRQREEPDNVSGFVGLYMLCPVVLILVLCAMRLQADGKGSAVTEITTAVSR